MKFITSNYYHIYNRGVEKRDIFLEENDYFRFVHGLYEFNDYLPVLNANRRFLESDNRTQDIDGGRTSNRRKRDQLVEIVCFCLMPNHFHLILHQLKENGVSQFMKKLGTGYAMYFNKKYKRVGSLFQGRFKSVLIESDEYLVHLSRYIHLNPVELVDRHWRERGIENWPKVKGFLQNYRYSSYLDYIQIKNFPSVTSSDFLLGYFKASKDYQAFVEEFVTGDLAMVGDRILE